MTKEIISREEIVRLHNEGWNFRKKNINGKIYISARKGKQEKGLGQFNQELWNLIENIRSPTNSKTNKKPNVGINNEPKSSSSSLESPSIYEVTIYIELMKHQKKSMFLDTEVEKALFDIKYERAKIKMQDCNHNWSGTCFYWEFERDSKLLAAIHERFKVKDDYKLPVMSNHTQLKKEQARDAIRASELLCFDCDQFVKRENPSDTII